MELLSVSIFVQVTNFINWFKIGLNWFFYFLKKYYKIQYNIYYSNNKFNLLMNKYKNG